MIGGPIQKREAAAKSDEEEWNDLLERCFSINKSLKVFYISKYNEFN